VHIRRKEVLTGLKLNTIGKTIKHLRGFLKDRVKRKIIAPIDLTDFKIPEEECDAIYLTHQREPLPKAIILTMPLLKAQIKLFSMANLIFHYCLLKVISYIKKPISLVLIIHGLCAYLFTRFLIRLSEGLVIPK